MEDFRRIIVRRGQPVQVVRNPTRYPLVGRGAHGAVFKLSHHQCVKIFPDQASARREGNALAAGQGSPVFPRLYERGSHYVVMEFVSGTSLYRYLKRKRRVSKGIAKQILFLLNELRKLKFSRRDAALRHLVRTDDGQLKVIDHANSRLVRYNRPVRLLRGLGQLGLRSSFLKRVKAEDHRLYRKWSP